jgi:hypothetical protein
LAAQHSDFDLDHVEPTCVLWGVVDSSRRKMRRASAGGNAW